MSQPKISKAQQAEERRKLWKEIAEHNGIENYINQKLRDAGFSLYVSDTSSMNNSQKKKYKAEKKKEAILRKELQKKAWLAYKETHLVHLGEDVFFNDLVDSDAFDVEKREQKLEEFGLPQINTVTELAEFLSLDIPQLRWLTYHRNAETQTHYDLFTIPKSNGKERIISAPKPLLKKTQRKILRQILEKLPIHGMAHGFVPGRSIVTHARNHTGAKLLLKMDLKDFFPSITLPRVKGLFRSFGYPEQIATLFALLCTDSPRELLEHQDRRYYVSLGPRSLPQGAPTSPAITNILCIRMDRRMAGLAKKNGFVYSRYADDLAFSWHQAQESELGKILRAGQKIIFDEGFQPHPEKTKIVRSGRRQKLTGLIINKQQSNQPTKPRVPRKLIRQVRAAIYNHQNGKETKQGESLHQLKGLAAFVYQSDPLKGKKYLQQIDNLIRHAEQENV